MERERQGDEATRERVRELAELIHKGEGLINNYQSQSLQRVRFEGVIHCLRVIKEELKGFISTAARTLPSGELLGLFANESRDVIKELGD